MAELMLVRHGQASFGAADYDKLSDLGHAQSRALGAHLRRIGWHPDRLITGTLRRQRETMASMDMQGICEEHAGFNEYSIDGSILTQQAAEQGGDRKAYFRVLRKLVLDWQKGGGSPEDESWAAFAARTAAAMDFATDTTAKRVLVVSSGGVIGRLVAATLQAPDAMMMELNLQVKNTAITRFVFSGQRRMLQEFNATPHLVGADDLVTFS